MKPIINPWMIYAIGILDDVKVFLTVTGIFGVSFAMLFLLFSVIGSDAACLERLEQDDDEYISRLIFITSKKALIASMICIALASLMPSTRTAYAMYAANYTTSENINAVGNVATDTIDYIFEKVDELQQKREHK